jgi:2-oxoglutarate/2-oxoacid ferredoxin oxidoreductase subunit alpha
MNHNLNWKIGGQAGYGIMVVGSMFAKTVMRHGWQVFCYTEYPSLIRGGHNTYQVHGHPVKVSSQKQQIEVLIALHEEAVTKHLIEVSPNGVIIYDSAKTKIAEERKDVEFLDVPLSQISTEICNSDLMKNTIALGASLALYNGDLEILNSVIKDSFNNKTDDVVKQNLEAVKRGYDFVKAKNINLETSLTKERATSRIIITGNEAVGLGALAAGCKFYVAYPMTPATNLLHFMAKNEREYDLVVRQAEDEIAVVNMAIAASFTGVRSLCGTSGGGFALMNESLGFAAIAEIPLVIMEGQRGGPATGMPTWTGQSDLLYAINASHGEFLRVVVAPGDIEEAFWATVNAFNLAEKFQIPVIILTDKYLLESPQSVEAFKTDKIKIDRGQILTQGELDRIKNFKRYEFTESGVSARTLPGMPGGQHQANSDEHDELGYSIEDSATRIKMMDKRLSKLAGLIKEIPEPKVYGDLKSKKTIICWGTTKMPVMEAYNQVGGFKVIHLQYLCPFPAEFILKNVDPKNSIIIEGNQTGQLAQLIRQQTGLEIKNTFLKYDGRPFYPEEIIQAINKL